MSSQDRKSRNRRGKVYPDESMDEEGKDNPSFAEDENSSLNKTKEKLKHAAMKDFSIRALTHAKNAGNRWRKYTCTRRQITSEGSEKRRTGGIGLEVDNDAAVSSVDMRDGKPPKRSTMRHEHNRNLIQYFARLAQSKKDDVEINLEYIDTQLESGANINCTDKYGQTILHEAARAWHVDVARYLLEKGAKINQGDNYGRTPLHVAAAVDYPMMVQLLIRKGADREALTKGEKQTPVHYAAKNDACQSLKALLKERCLYKDVRDYKGRTPLHIAAELDRSETARYLLELDDPAPAGVEDDEGQSAIVWMIAKMPPVAKLALGQLHTTDRASRKQSFHLHRLEPRKPGIGRELYPQTAMQVAVSFRRMELVSDPVFLELINLKWRQYGRRGAIINMFVNCLFILTWTLNAVLVEYDVRHKYDLPTQWYRIVLLIAAIASTAWQLKEELTEFFQSKRIFNKWKEWREEEIRREKKYAHPRWPEEEKYLESELGDLDEQRPQYFSDFWNIFDWVCYFLLLVCITTHFIDVGYHTNFIARLHIRIMAVTIILIWIRLLKNARAFAYLGPFIVILTHMTGDVTRFVLLYLEFFIPFACAFWMLFGGDKTPERYQGLPNPQENTIEVSGMEDWGALMFSLFRLTLVDEYDYDGMKEVDSVMATFLCFMWLALSAILMLNLFIALLSDTFQRVYDNAQANAIMQKAITIIGIEEGLSLSKREKFRTFIHTENAPRITFYDDDFAEPGGGLSVQKVTIQIKEQLDAMEEHLNSGKYFSNAYNNQRRARNDSTSSMYRPGGGFGGNNDDDDDEGGGGKSTGRSSAAGGGGWFHGGDTEQLEKQVSVLQKQVTKLKAGQDEMNHRVKKDMAAIKNLLYQIAAYHVPPNETGDDAGSGREFKHNNILTEMRAQAAPYRAIEPVTAFGLTSLPPAHPATLTRSLTMGSDTPAPQVRSQLNNVVDEERELLERQRQLELDQLRHQLQQQSDTASHRDDVLSGSQLVVEVSEPRPHVVPAVLIRPGVVSLGTNPSSSNT